MSRFRAAGIHFLISVLIVITVLALMLSLWYPGAYFKLMGGAGLLYILSGVDVTLGPLLTLIVFKSGKKTLKFDLAVIGLIQLCALCYGLYAIFLSRPVFTVFNGQGFQVAAVADLDAPDLAQATNPKWKKFPLTGPIILGSKLPDDQDKRSDIALAIVFGGGIQQYPKYWVEYADVKDKVLAAAKPLADLKKAQPKDAPAVDKFLSKARKSEQDVVYLPVSTKFAELPVMIDAKSAEVLDILDFSLPKQ